MADFAHTIRPNDKIPWPVEGAVKDIMVEILTVTKPQDGIVHMDLKAVEDAIAADGSILVSAGDTTIGEMDIPDGYDFDPVPRSTNAPAVTTGPEMKIGDDETS